VPTQFKCIPIHISIDSFNPYKMKTEITVALFGLGGTVLGALIGAVVSAITARQQASLSLKQLKLEMLKNQISILGNALSSISSVGVDVSDLSLTVDQIYSRYIDRFLECAKLFMNISYLFPNEFEARISNLCEEINQCIFLVKTGHAIDEALSRTLIDSIRAVEEEMDRQIRGKLRSLHSELDKAMFSRRLN
jgi:hypothetical protein